MNLGLDILRIYDNIQELHYSDQLQAVLDDREIQHLLVCNPDGKVFGSPSQIVSLDVWTDWPLEIAIARLSYWIGHKILYLIRWNNSNDVGKFELKELLEKLLKFTHFAKVGVVEYWYNHLIILTYSSWFLLVPTSCCSSVPQRVSKDMERHWLSGHHIRFNHVC